MKERLGGGNNEKVRRPDGGEQLKTEEESGGLVGWPGSDSGSTQVRGSISTAIRSIGHMQSLQYDSWSNDMVPNN